MKAVWLLCGGLLALSLSIHAFSQSHGGPGGRGSTGGRTGGVPVGGTIPQPGLNGSAASLPPFISGKVVLDDGTLLTEPVAIETLCQGNRQTVAFTDSHGEFSFQFGDPTMAASADVSDGSNSMLSAPQNRSQAIAWKECELDAVLAGFTSEVIELAGKVDSLDDSNIGRIRLHRIAQVEGASISVTSALAPDSAKNALRKAREEEKKGKWDKAEALLKKAVQIYPKYSSAWFELGRVQVERKDLTAAKQSFQQSITADPKFVNPYDALAQLAFRDKQWPEVIETTNKLIALNPVNFPTAYFLNGVANYYSRNLDAAEKIAREGIKADPGHTVPKLQYLLGMVLIQKHDYNGARDSLKQYIQLTKQPSEIAEGQRELGEIEKLSAKQPVEDVKR